MTSSYEFFYAFLHFSKSKELSRIPKLIFRFYNVTQNNFCLIFYLYFNQTQYCCRTKVLLFEKDVNMIRVLNNKNEKMVELLKIQVCIKLFHLERFFVCFTSHQYDHLLHAEQYTRM
jgi:hypothetical protein